ncbi:hypothetical protein L1887_03233 [Cichorium endivia]|nr:hypothetical protein L1887_03233 [Cichorium endivia]
MLLGLHFGLRVTILLKSRRIQPPDSVLQSTIATVRFYLIDFKGLHRVKISKQQGQMLTFVEYTLLLYRAFLASPVWIITLMEIKTMMMKSSIQK